MRDEKAFFERNRTLIWDGEIVSTYV